MKFFKNLNHEDFKEFMAFFSISFSFLYMMLVTFCTIPKENQRFADIILGSLLTIVIGKVLGEYFNANNDEDKGKENEVE
jgi:hypothetical protein